MKLLPLLPEAQNEYQGYKAVVALLVLLTIASTVRSLIHIFAPDGGSHSIAGLVIPGDANTAVIFTFAWAGLFQLVVSVTQWFILIRYRQLIPLMILLMLFEQLGMFLLPMFKPIALSLRTHIPPEAIGNKVMLPLLLIMFFVSLIPARTQKSKSVHM